MNRAVPRKSEFIAICALLMSVVALSIDVMLPALGELSAAFGIAEGNERQLVIVALFVGLAGGQLYFGPASDAVGRRPMVFIGVAVFIVGSVTCAMATSFQIMCVGRILQGFGAAGPRIVTVALIRDRFAGQDMAQVMSVIMGLFIFVPILAPSLGQLLLFVMPWRGLFIVLALMSLMGGLWLALRQTETLVKPVAFSLPVFARACLEVLHHSKAMAYTFAGACAYGALMGYVNSSQQLFQELYRVGDGFALWFGGSAAFISAATFLNARLVTKIRMERVCMWAVAVLCLWTLGFGLSFWVVDAVPVFWVWMVFNCGSLFLLGLTFGNFNAIALKPFGASAGIAAAVVASLTTTLSLSIAWLIGRFFDGTVAAVTVGYLVCGMSALVALLMCDRQSISRSAVE